MLWVFEDTLFEEGMEVLKHVLAVDARMRRVKRVFGVALQDVHHVRNVHLEWGKKTEWTRAVIVNGGVSHPEDDLQIKIYRAALPEDDFGLTI